MHTEPQFERILSTIDEIVYRLSITDDPFRSDVTFVSPQITRILGYEPAEVVGRPGLWSGILHPDDAAALAQAAQQPHSCSGARAFQYRLKHKITGEYRWVEDRAIGERNADGRLAAVVGTVRDITECKLTEQALRESEQKLRLWLEQLPGTLWTTDLDLRISSVHRSPRLQLGEPPEDMLGRTIPELFPGRDSRFTPIAVHLRALAGEAGDYEITFLQREWQIWVQPLRDAAGKIIGCLGQGLDVTERKRAEAKFRNLLEAAPDAMVIADPDGHIVLVNRQTEQLFGYARDELLGKPVELLMPERFREAHVMQRSRYAARPIPRPLGVGLQLFGLRKDGSEFPADIVLSPIETEEGMLTTAAVRDITGWKRAETALRESEERFRVIINHAPLTLFATDSRGVFTFSDGKGLEGTGLSPGDNVGRSAYELFGALPVALHTGDVITGADVIRRVLAGEALSGVTHVFNKSFDNRFVPLEDANKQVIGLIGVAVDITERKRAEDNLSRSHQQLRELGRRSRAARERERAMIAREIHDEVGHALTALKMDLSWLRDRLPAHGNEVARKTRDMLTLIDATINHARALASQLRPAVLDQLGLLAAIEWEAQEFTRRTRVPCELELPVENTQFDADRSTDVFRILQEALTNITRHARATAVIIRLQVSPEDLVLAVHDNGRGITDHEISNAGSLGLVGMRERALLWRGELGVRRVRRGGTCVTARIPLA